MSKPAAERRLDDSEALASLRGLRISARKLNLVARAIRGKTAASALAELTFSRRRIAGDVKKVLQAAIANAENNHQLDVDRLYVKEATVGRAFVLKRFHTRGRGRSARVEKHFAHLTVIVRASTAPGIRAGLRARTMPACCSTISGCAAFSIGD
jgi:large subunit ribosomal protein L22